MADINNLKANLIKNEEKLSKKIVLLAKYESKKEKLENQFVKISNGVSFSEALELSKKSDKSTYDFFRTSYGEDSIDIMYKLETFYDNYWSPVIQTKNAISELERKVSSYKEKIEKEEKFVEERNASMNDKNVKVIVDFLNDWEKKVVDYLTEVFVKYENCFKKEYDEVVKSSFEYNIIYSFGMVEDISEKWISSEYAKFYPTYDEYRKNARYNDPCKKLIKDNLAKINEKVCSKYSITTIEKYGKSVWNPNKDEYMNNMKKDIAEEKNRKYDQLIADVESVVGQIFDMTNVHVGYRGDLEGYVIGTNGEAEVWTTGCGGYNEDVIVNVKHGQKFHFRFFVRKRA